jgi:hypothetical protein
VSAIGYAKARLLAVLDEVKRLKEGEFPYPHSRKALDSIHSCYEQHLTTLNGLSVGKDVAIVNAFCGEALYDIFKYLPFLGFVLRSTNVRNAFEVYGPLLRLSQKVLGPNTMLILSSEWEFSPLTYPEALPLPDFVLIGLPASEADNPLLLPLAGHELGHTVWAAHNYETGFENIIEREVLVSIHGQLVDYQKIFPNDNVRAIDAISDLDQNIFVKKTIAIAVRWGLLRAEEYFCDCVGYFLFDEAFLHAYAYLVAPKVACQRSLGYPNNLARIDNLMTASAHFQRINRNLYKIPPGYRDLFEDEDESTELEEQFLSYHADVAAKNLCATLISEVERLLVGVDAPVLKPSKRDSIIEDYRIMVPACETESMTNILNAAWSVFHDAAFWPDITDAWERQRTLQELVLKNIEVLEIDERLKA